MPEYAATLANRPGLPIPCGNRLGDSWLLLQASQALDELILQDVQTVERLVVDVLLAQLVPDVLLRVEFGRMSIAWLLAKSPVMLPIPGTQSIDHLEENVRAAALRLAPEDFDDLR